MDFREEQGDVLKLSLVTRKSAIGRWRLPAEEDVGTTVIDRRYNCTVARRSTATKDSGTDLEEVGGAGEAETVQGGGGIFGLEEHVEIGSEEVGVREGVPGKEVFLDLEVEAPEFRRRVHHARHPSRKSLLIQKSRGWSIPPRVSHA